MTLAVVEFVTLDGVMQGLGSPDEDLEGGFEYGGWGPSLWRRGAGQDAAAGNAATTSYLFGRKTYETMAAHWPNEPDNNPIAARLNAAPKYVVTNTLTTLDWAGSRVLAGDAQTSVSELKSRGDGAVVVLGSGVLVQTLIEYDLIDEYRVPFLDLVQPGAGWSNTVYSA